MSDMHLREKMRKVTEAAKQGDHVPEPSKKAGFIIFLLFDRVWRFCPLCANGGIFYE